MNIFNLLAGLIDRFLALVLSMFPVADLGVVSTIQSSLDDFHGYLQNASVIFPVNSFLFLLSSILVIEVSLFTYRLIKLVLGYISGGILRD